MTEEDKRPKRRSEMLPEIEQYQGHLSSDEELPAFNLDPCGMIACWGLITYPPRSMLYDSLFVVGYIST